MAKLQYQLPRLHTGLADKLDQQTAGNAGGGYTNRGAGETKRELNRRHIKFPLDQVILLKLYHCPSKLVGSRSK